MKVLVDEGSKRTTVSQLIPRNTRAHLLLVIHLLIVKTTGISRNMTSFNTDSLLAVLLFVVYNNLLVFKYYFMSLCAVFYEAFHLSTAAVSVLYA